tara:strand:+ start:1517 stop:1906 length:390 start_codon:yes stop_codon:yes gene_type:complete
MEFLDLVKIGSVVQINANLSKDRLSPKTLEAINYSSKCLVEDFRLTDGKGVGVVVKLSNGEREWFFENEIEILDSNGNIIPREQKEENLFLFLKNFIENLEYIPKKKIIDLINPINFAKWVIYSFKDIF